MKNIRISMKWQLLCDVHGFSREHYNQLKKFSPGALREIIAEIACCHPSTSVLLRNKWLTPPEDILGQVIREYERRIRDCPSLRNENEAESWLNELVFAVIVPCPVLLVENLNRLNLFFYSLLLNRSVFGNLSQRMMVIHGRALFMICYCTLFCEIRKVRLNI